MKTLLSLLVLVVALAVAGTHAAEAGTHVAPKNVGCDACHVPGGWRPARFAHERTAFPLLGRHEGVRCSDCHGTDLERPLPTSCAGCHRDPHGQEFGLQCRSCHDEQGFRAPAFSVDAHRRTQFPLVGRHAALPCDECHVEKRERAFSRAPVECVSCHQKDAQRASAVTLDHGRAPFATSCKGCHEPVAFSPARFPDHERCFPISSGVHQRVSCNECHGSLRGERADGRCAGEPVRCAQCHAHRKAVEDRHHKDVAGYAHDSRRCAACHRAVR